MRQFACLLAFLVSLSSLGTPLSAQPNDPAAARFGVVGGYLRPDEAAELGAGWDVIPFEWAEFQPDGGHRFAFSAVNPRWLADAAAAQRDVVGLIRATPGWASVSGAPSAVPAGLYLPVADPGNVWAAFVARLVQHYAPRGVHHWIIYETPNVRAGEGRLTFAGSAADYAQMVHVAHEAAKTVDPACQIHTAPLHPWVDTAAGREPYLSALLRALAELPGAQENGHYFDVLTLRALNDTAALWESIAGAQALLERLGIGPKPIWLEVGASPTAGAPGGGPDSVVRISAEQQADFLVQAAAAGLAAGVERIGAYRLADDPGDPVPWGLIAADGTRRPAFDVYRRAIELFGPTVSAQRFAVEGGDLVLLRQPERDLAVMWAGGSQPLTFAITAPAVGERAALHSAAGNQTIAAEAFNWPAAYTVEVPAARLDPHGWLTVAGAPRTLALPTTDFFRVFYLVDRGAYRRLK